MTGWSLMAIIVVVLGVTQGPKLLAEIRRLAVAQGDDPGSLAGALWAVFVLACGVGFGALAVRRYWQAQSFSHGAGDMLHLVVAAVVFMLAFALGVAVLGWVSRSQAALGRLLTAVVALGVLGAGLVMPMRRDAAAGRAQAQASDLAWFEDNLATLQAQMAQTPHAPPGSVPPELEVVQESDGLRVSLLGRESMRVSLLYVLPHGRQWERCWAGVQDDCSTLKPGCPYQLAPDGTRVPSSGLSAIDPQPAMRPGQSLRFVHACDARFKGAPLEFRLSAVADGRTVFQSDSAFVPDTPWLP